MTTNGKIILGSIVGLASVFVYKLSKAGTLNLSGVPILSKIASEHNKLQSEIDRLTRYYATPRGEQTGAGHGVDLCKMTDDYGVEGVKQFIYVWAKYYAYLKDNRALANGYQEYSYALYDQWLQSGVYQAYKKAKAGSFPWAAVAQIAMTVAMAL